MTIIAKEGLKALIRQTPPLIEEANVEQCLKSASYDLRLGSEYYKNGKIEHLIDTSPWLEIPAYELVIVTSHEKVNMRNNLTARFGLRLGLVKKGVILHNEPQIDPGYRGRLACLLFNLSSEPVRIEHLARFATIEFEETSEEAPPYEGPHEGFNTLDQFFRGMDKLPVSGLYRLHADTERMTGRVERFTEMILIAFSVMITLLSVIFFLFLRG